MKWRIRTSNGVYWAEYRERFFWTRLRDIWFKSAEQGERYIRRYYPPPPTILCAPTVKEFTLP